MRRPRTGIDEIIAITAFAREEIQICLFMTAMTVESPGLLSQMRDLLRFIIPQ